VSEIAGLLLIWLGALVLAGCHDAWRDRHGGAHHCDQVSETADGEGK